MKRFIICLLILGCLIELMTSSGAVAGGGVASSGHGTASPSALEPGQIDSRSIQFE